MKAPDNPYNMTTETTVVERDGGFIVKVDIVSPIGRMHAMDIGPVATQEEAESLAEHVKTEVDDVN